MWRTPFGKRVLTDAEWALFRDGASCLFSEIIDPYGAFETDINVFDRLQRGQKLALLLEVAQALSDPRIPPPELVATNETAELARDRGAIRLN